MTIDDLEKKGLIVLKCLSGSRAYGLDTPASDTDYKGVFILPKEDFYGMNYIPQISNETNDIVYYEIGRFMELLGANNPNILELLYTTGDAVLFKHALLDMIKPEMVLSKMCEKSFGKFAISQIKKAKGLNKKILNPMGKDRKSVLDFCYVNYDHGSISLNKFLASKGWNQEDCGLVKIPHMNDVYGLYHSTIIDYNGIMRHEDSNSVVLSSIPKGEVQVKLLYFNQNGYSSFCKEYREYWKWVEKRNESRFENTMSHGKNYDAKNMMHTFRLLEMALEIAREQKVHVKRKDRDYLLKIKSGGYEYEDLLDQANAKQEMIEEAFGKSKLPERPDIDKIRKLTYKIRAQMYEEGIGA